MLESPSMGYGRGRQVGRSQGTWAQGPGLGAHPSQAAQLQPGLWGTPSRPFARAQETGKWKAAMPGLSDTCHASSDWPLNLVLAPLPALERAGGWEWP